MKKIVLFAVLLLTTASALRAQIVLNSSNYIRSLPGTVDSLRDATPASLILPIQSGANVTWDFTALTYLPGWDTIHYYGPANPSPAAQYRTDRPDSISYSYRFNARLQQGVATGGILTYGIHIDSSSYSMGFNTGNNNDSFRLYTQDIVFSAPQKELALPASYLLNWQSNSRGTIAGEVTCNTLHYNKAPYRLATSRFLQDTVVGWGKLQLKDDKGITSAAMDVLQVRRYETRVDSGFINGISIDHFEGLYMDLPKQLISGTCQDRYYRIGEVTPLVTITYMDSRRTQVTEVRVHQRRLSKLGIDQLPLQSKLTVSPNPATGNRISVTGIDELQSGIFSYQLISANGQVAAAGPLSSGTISLPGSINAGIFYIQIVRNKEVVAVKPLSIVR